MHTVANPHHDFGKIRQTNEELTAEMSWLQAQSDEGRLPWALPGRDVVRLSARRGARLASTEMRTLLRKLEDDLIALAALRNIEPASLTGCAASSETERLCHPVLHRVAQIQLTARLVAPTSLPDVSKPPPLGASSSSTLAA